VPPRDCDDLQSRRACARYSGDWTEPFAAGRFEALMPTEVREPGTAAAEEAALVARLRAGDEQAFAALVERHYATMLSVARTYVKTRAVAEEVVQEAWLGVIKGLDRFEGRSSLRTWILRILVNIAKTRGVREARSVPFASLAPEGDEPAVAPERFNGAPDPYPGHWCNPPEDWRALPEAALFERETLEVVMAAIERLAPAQRTVITMRDVAGCDAAEVCATLGISEGNQRVLLHRARSRVRTALERHLHE
jgi:RNA polymerase sigma-70 factor (ECF subfamily)